MENYIGKSCPFCKTEIKAGDAVKVCPACGIPHHEECWEENKGCTTFGCSEQHYEPQGTNPTEVCSNCGATLGDGQMFCSNCGTAKKASAKNVCGKCGEELQEGQEFCPKCGQKVGVMLDSNLSDAINQFNAKIESDSPKKKNICSVLAIIFGAIGIIPILNFIFLPAAIVLAIIGLAISKGRRKGATIASIIVVSVSLLISIIWLVAGSGSEDFNDMYSGIAGESWCEIAADGSWMEIDTNPYDIEDENEYEAISMIETINSELGFSSYVYEEMLETRALDGRQSETSGSYTVSWSYHPDSGMEVLYKIND